MIATLLTRYLSIFFQFVIIYSTFYVYGDDGRGVVVALTSTYTIVGLIISLTLGRGFLEQFQGVEKGDASELLMSTMLILVCFLLLLSIITHFGLLNFFPKFYGGLDKKYVFIYLTASSYYLWVQISQYIYSVFGKLKLYNLHTIILGIFQSLLCVYSIIFKMEFVWFLAFNSIIFFLFFLINGFSIVFFQPFGLRFDLFVAKKLCKSGLKLHLDTMGGYMFSAVSILIVNFYLPLGEVAKYDLVIKVFSIIIVFPQVMQLIFNKLVFAEGHEPVIVRQVKIYKLVSGYYILMLLLVLPICYFFVDYNFSVILLIAISFFSYYWCSIISPYWIRDNKGLQLSLVTVIVGVFSILLMFFLIPELGVLAAAIGVFLSYGIAALINVVFYLKEVKCDVSNEC